MSSGFVPLYMRTAVPPGLGSHWTFPERRSGSPIGLTAVGKLLDYRNRVTTAVYAHLDDAPLRNAAAQAATVIARAMGYRAEPPPLPSEANWEDASEVDPELLGSGERSAERGRRRSLRF